ncbi:hypothetical protein ACHAWU_008354 [Discostella pseudostelligera]|uniref:Sulfite exporter TauE/SafE family protein n=1 Tax=Discostella pseudostelligera TaxID=259834 RepID=A0ABD3M3I4_9STRA
MVTRTSFLASFLIAVVVAIVVYTSAAENSLVDSDLRIIFATEDTNSTSSIINNHALYHGSLIPLQLSDIVGFFCAALGLIIAAGGGIGGGGILVPIYILILGFLPKHAIPLSNVTVLGGAVASTLQNMRKRHPTADRPLIDWDLIVAMEPPTVAGALIGANLNKILPEAVIAVMLSLLLSFTAYATLKKARIMHQKETEKMRKSQAVGTLNEYLLLHDNPPIEHEESVCLVSNNTSSIHHCHQPIHFEQDCESEDERSIEDDLPEFGDPITLSYITEEERHPKARNVILIFVMFSVVLIINILKGGGGFQSPVGISCGSSSFWCAQGLILVWIFFISWRGRRFLLKDTDRKIEAGYIYLDEDVMWDKKSTIRYPLISTLAGCFAGMFGIGGGIIKGPLMLAMGIHPAVASATSSCMILFTSFTATTTFSVYGLMIPDYAIACSILGFGATYLGQTFMSSIIANSNRNSYIAFSIGMVVLLSAILMTLEFVLQLASGEKEEVGGICGNHVNEHPS